MKHPKHPQTLFRRMLFVSLTGVLLPANATFMLPAPVPLAEMEASLGAKIEKEPDNPLWSYRLGRVAYLVFETGAAAAYVRYPGEPAERFPSDYLLYWSIQGLMKEVEAARNREPAVDWIPASGRPEEPGWKIQLLDQAERIQYAARAQRNLQHAVDSDAGNGLYALTLGSFQMDWLDWVPSEPPALPEGLKAIQLESALGWLERAWRAVRETDLARERLPVQGEKGLYSLEAATRWLERAPKGYKPEIREQMREDVERMRGIPRGMITPLVFDPREGATMPGDRNRRVRFDLSGQHLGGEWTWIRDGAAFLVWDPEEEGVIRSGRRLFGGYTWQLLWEDGFAPLGVLDRNRDGVLAGSELTGLSAWFDRPPLGTSDAREVVPLRELGVESVSVASTPGEEPGVLRWNPEGVRFSDGRVVPLWDWLAEPCAPESIH